MRHRIYITEYDAIDFCLEFKISLMIFLFMLTPLILVQGEGLYLHAFDSKEHLELANLLTEAEFLWILTYDDDPRITDILYKHDKCAIFDISHTAHRQHIGTESVIYSKELNIPDLEVFSGNIARWVK